MDINQKLLAAFQVEHIEHLEGIRACLATWEEENDASNVDEAFRHAHSLKGAARITGFTPVETLAHCLESLFSLFRAKTLQTDKRVFGIVHAALDAIEDTTACLMQDRPPPDSSPVLAALDALVSGPKAARRAPPSPALKQKLRAAFEEEYRSHVDGIRRILAQAREPGPAPARIDVDEAFRCANSLKGAARLAEAAAVEMISQRLETLFSRIREGNLALNSQVIDVAEQVLGGIEQIAANSNPDLNGSQAAAVQAIERLLGKSTEVAPSLQPLESTASASLIPQSDKLSTTARLQPMETVRLSTESLDRLLQSTSQLLTENLQQESLVRELTGIGRAIATIDGEWESLKRTAAGPLRRLSTMPELAGLSRYIDFVDHEINALSRRVRAVRLQQQRSAWSVKLLGEQLQQDVRRARMVPAENAFQGFRKMMRDLARDDGKEIEFRVSGLEVHADRMVFQALKDPLMHVLRNAVSHGIEPPEERSQHGKSPKGVVTLDIRTVGNRLTIVVEDDGRGIDLAKVSEVAVRRGVLSESEAAARPVQELARLLFQPGFSTSRLVTELSGRGMGLSAAYETVTRLQGEIDLQPRDSAGTSVLLKVPLSISTHRLLLVSCRGQTFAIPCYGIEGLHRVKVQDIETVEGKPMVSLGGLLTPLTSLDQLLDEAQTDASFAADRLFLAVLRSGPKRVAVAVDAFVAERNAFVKNLGPPADQLFTFVGGILLEDGSVSLVLNPSELVDRFKPSKKAATFKPGKPTDEWHPPTVLVVDDSFTTRTLETSILEANGYRVRVAVDGIEALEQLRSEKIDLVISDIQMPRLDGFGLLEEMKRDERLARIPVIVVSSVDRKEDQERGLNLGADAYIVKRKFDHQDLLKTIQQIL